MSRTLLLLTPTLVARGDFDRNGILGPVVSAPPPPQVTELASLTLAALGLIKAAPKRVSVLTTAAVTAMVETTPGRFQGLTDQERNAALAFEAEAMTGVPALASQTAAQRRAGESGTEHWWVTQIAHAGRGQISAEITRRGARLEAIAHPGGLAAFLDQPEERLELWHDLLLMHRSTAAGAALDILSVDETAPLASLLERFPGGGGDRSVLTVSSLPPIEGVVLRSLHEEGNLRQWLTAWHEVLTAPSPALPVLLSPPQPMSTARRIWVSVGTGAAAAGLCAGHWWLTETQLQRASTELKEISILVKAREELKKASAEVGRLKTELETARQAQGQALSGFGALLTAVAELRPAGLVVRTLKDPTGSQAGSSAGKYAGMEASVAGSCTHQELAAQFSGALGARLAPIGWAVRPARTSVRLVGGTPLWDFEIPLRLDSPSPSPGPP